MMTDFVRPSVVLIPVLFLPRSSRDSLKKYVQKRGKKRQNRQDLVENAFRKKQLRIKNLFVIMMRSKIIDDIKRRFSICPTERQLDVIFSF